MKCTKLEWCAMELKSFISILVKVSLLDLAADLLYFAGPTSIRVPIVVFTGVFWLAAASTPMDPRRSEMFLNCAGLLTSPVPIAIVSGYGDVDLQSVSLLVLIGIIGCIQYVRLGRIRAKLLDEYRVHLGLD